MLAQSITGGDVGGGHGAELHGDERLVPSETPKSYNMPGVWSGTHSGVHDGTPTLYAHD